jgi:hypothetical protein
MEKLIIEIKYGGLGDHLFFSHIPRIAKLYYSVKKVYISNRSELRNEGIKKLVWELNPYVDGFIDEEGTYYDEEIIKSNIENTNLLDKVMLSYGFDDNLRFHEPEVYYKPKRIDYFAEKSIFDPNYISNIGIISRHKLKIMLKRIEKLSIMKKLNRQAIIIKNMEVIESKDLSEYCDIIFSCKNFYCMSSGGATLSAALNKKANVFYGYGQPELFLHSKLNNYIDISGLFAKQIYYFYSIFYKYKKYFVPIN